MNSITIFRQFFCFNVKNDYTIITSEMFCISFNLRRKIINNSLCIPYFIHRELKPNGTITFKHFCKVSAHLVVKNIITYYYHLNSKIGYSCVDLQPIKHL